MPDNSDQAAVRDNVTTLSGKSLSQGDQPALASLSPQQERKPDRAYIGFVIWGVPYSEVDIDYAVDCLFKFYYAPEPGSRDAMLAAMDRMINQSEKIVSRCGMLMSFSGILIAISLYIATNPNLLPALWQRCGFYTALLFWVISILRLLWSLKHMLPSPSTYGTEIDFRMTARLFLGRMGLYNILLINCMVSFSIMMVLLTPISATFVDAIFGR